MEKSSFFNSKNHDRKYSAADWAAYFASFIGNGVLANPSNALQVMASTGMAISIRPGKAFINGYRYENDAALTKTLNVADGVNDRIDRVVCRWNLLARTMTTEILTGTPSGSPVAPVLTRSIERWEIAYADIRVKAGAASITQQNIKDQRPDGNLCGFVTGLIDQLDFSSLTEQIETLITELEEKIAQAADGAIPDDAVTSPKIQNGAVTAPKLAAGAVSESKIAADAVSTFRTANLSASGWSGSGDVFKQTVPLTGIHASSRIFVDINCSAVSDSGLEELNVAWGDILKATCNEDSVTFVSKYIPSVAIPVKILEVKK